MAVSFITGKTASGKTAYLINTIIKKSQEAEKNSATGKIKRHILIVPEQSTLDIQHETIKKHPNHCITNIEILSFNRLAHRMVDELAVAGKTVISDVGKNMMIRRLIQAEKGSYPFFEGNIHKKGYVSELKNLMSEFSRYALDDMNFQEVLSTIEEPLLSNKMKDCQRLYKSYKDEVEESHFTGDTLNDLLTNVIDSSQFIKDSAIYIDGFYGFTPIQYKLIEKLLCTAHDITVTFTVDAMIVKKNTLSENHLYYESYETYRRIKNMVREHSHLEVNDITLDREIQLGALDHLRDHLYQYPYKVYPGEVKGATIFKASSIGKEVAYLRDSILNLVMNKGYRYKDISVLVGDVSSYEQQLTTMFSKVSIPYYMDQKKSILNNDIAVLVLNIIRLMQYNLSYKYIFTYIKSGYIEVDEEILYYLENYVIRYGIRGISRWSKEWTMKVPDVHGDKDSQVAKYLLEQINQLRQTIVEPINNYIEKKPKTIKAHVKALYEFLEAINLEKAINDKASHYEATGELALYREYSQMYGFIMDLLDQLYEIGVDDVMDFQGFYEIVEAGFEEMEIGNVPARMDEVLVGDLIRSRLSKRKVIFILGINEGKVPVLREGTSIITDEERDFLLGKGFELAPSVKKNLFRDQFYIYLKLFLSTEHLYLSYALMGDEGATIRPAHLIFMIKKILPHIHTVDVDEVYNKRERYNHPEVVYENLIKGLQLEEQVISRPESQKLAANNSLMDWYNQDESYRHRLKKALEGKKHHTKEDSLSEENIAKLYGEKLLNTVTRLEQFAKCPFNHFVTYGLKAKERETYEITMPQLGLVFHRVIELFSKRVIERKIQWQDITEAIRQAWIEELVDHTLSEESHQVFFDTKRNQYRINRLKVILNKTIKAIGYQISQGSFNPVSAEWQFRGDDDDVEALNLSLNKKKTMCLLGTIDRVDVYENDAMRYLTIVDYKSSNKDFDLGEVYQGLQLQLILYLNAAVEITDKGDGPKTTPAGIFYFKIDDPFVVGKEGQSADDIEKDFEKSFRLKGMVLDDEVVISHLDRFFTKESNVIPVKRKKDGALASTSKTIEPEELETVRHFVNKTATTLGNRIIDGEIEPLPYRKKDQKVCDYCLYNSICGFDDKLPRCNYKEYLEENQENYIRLMKKEVE